MKNSNLALKILAIVGPTASGKSDLAIRLAKLVQNKSFKKHSINGAEIISADSRQVYRMMDIGTGKVPKDRLNNGYFSKGIRHHLIDVADPKKQFTADDFKRLGEKAITDVKSRRAIPIIVGGTGFYIDILLGRMSVAEVPPNQKLRKRLDGFSAKHLLEMLQKLDPERAKAIEPKNKRRLIRALEIVLTTGKPTSRTVLSSKYKILWLGINPGREQLAIRIKKRLNARLKHGMIKEVINLHRLGVSWKRLDDMGLEYRQISRFLTDKKLKVKNEKNFKKSEYYQKLLREITKYSKRQMTWFKRNKEIRWLSPTIRDRKTAEKLFTRFFF